MLEKIRFLSPEEKKEREIAETLEKEGGIFYRAEVNPETGKEKCFVNILGVELETYASKEDIEAIKKEVVLSEVDQNMLRIIAENYKLRQSLMFEGDPGVGKTFLMKKFVQLIHGKEAPILELVGTPRTSELEILGHWAPVSSTKESKDPVVQDTIRRYERLEKEYQSVNDEYDRGYQELKKSLDSGKISQNKFKQEFTDLNEWYKPLQERYSTELQALWQRSRDRMEWEFKEGALLQAYAGREGKGYILIVDEFNLIPSNYQQIFLQIGGEKGALSESISFWGNTGKTRYPRGKDTWICFASNYPEKTPGRSEVVAPMTDRLVWRTITSEEVEKKKKILRLTMGGQLTKRLKEMTKLVPEIVSVPVERGLDWRKVLDQQLGEQLGDVIDLLDEMFVNHYQEVGDSINNITIKSEKRRRIQQLAFERNHYYFYSYLDHFQIRDPKTGQIDFTKSLFNAFNRYYLDRLVDPDVREEMEKLFDEILGLNISPQELKAIKETEKILKADGKKLPLGVALFEGEIRTRKEIFDILVERASLTEEERQRIQEEQKEKEEREKLQTIRDIKDLLS